MVLVRLASQYRLDFESIVRASARSVLTPSSVNQLKTICDENLANVLDSLGYTESHALGDLKLALGVGTVVVSGLLFAVEKKYSFNESYNITIGALGVYFLLSAVLWYLTQTKDHKNVQYIGNNGDKTIAIATTTTKYDPVYNMELKIGDLRVSTSIEFMKLFDTFTTFHPEGLKELIGGEIKKKNQ